MTSRIRARENAFKALFQLDINQTSDYRDLLRSLESDIDPYTEKIIKGVFETKEHLDQQISDYLEKWTFDRIGTVEKTVIRIALYEILYVDEVPNKVSINEAVEIAKRFHDERAGKFINGILSKFVAE